MATKIESQKVTVNASIETVYAFLLDFNNIEQLLPKDKISEWKSDFDQCSFKVQNAALIPLIKSSVKEGENIHIISGDKAPFKFTLDINFTKVNEQTETVLEFNGEINAFLKMMVVKPLTNLFDYMANRIQQLHK
ncbi:SRPBCC family protein [Crocinitomix catalasitica]|uniref:SRPBCC family protein n=1 Tax=Crocinitomix catalasitica TaxID=184607 RepID=UPI0005620174|nr:SRPBCC family protein [Crocinitomix catalasitica]